MRRGLTGCYEVGTVTGSGPFQAFVPDPLPPAPPLDLTGPLRQSLDDTLVALRRLDSVSTLLPDATLEVRGNRVIDGDTNDRDGRISRPRNLRASNGIIHVINKVLLPPAK